jgi:phospholipase/carboxylesterase
MNNFVSASINLHYELHVPDENTQDAPLLIAVHGYAANMNYMMREAKQIAPDNFVIASLQAPNRFWRESSNGTYKVAFGWLNDFETEESIGIHHEFLIKVIEQLSGQGLVDPKRVFLYGFSQACALNFKFAFTHPDLLRGIAGVCGGIPGDLDTNEVYKPTNASVLYLYGDDDEFYPLDKFVSYEKRLTEFLPDVSAKRYGATHQITPQMREDLSSWLEAFQTQGESLNGTADPASRR